MMEYCKNCGKVIKDRKKYRIGFCSNKCYEDSHKFSRPPNCKCSYCGKEMYLKQYRIKRAINGVTCSKECSNAIMSKHMKGKNNHQFGLTGSKNPSFKGLETISNYGYILEYCKKHPYPHNKKEKGTIRVLQHRLVVERNYKKFNPVFFENVDGMFVLKQCYNIHHKDENKKNNSLDNLEVMTRSEHIRKHNMGKKIIRDHLGRIIGVVKLGNIGEGLTANPEISLEIAKGSKPSYSVEGE